MADARANPTQELDRAIVALLLKEPFYGHLLGAVVRRADAGIPTAAVTLTPRGVHLVVNPSFFQEKLTPQERIAVVKHEALHLALRHLYRPVNEHEDPLLCNLAADLVVNQLVAPWPLPDGAILLSTFPDMGLLPDRSLEWYLERLKRLQQEMQQSGSSGCSAPQSAAALTRLGADWPGNHVGWANVGGEGFGGDAPALTEVLRRAMENDMERLLTQARARLTDRQWGQLPGGLRSSLERMAEARSPRVDWRRSLRLFASSSYRTRVVPTMRRMSKRFQEFPGIRISREQRVAVVLDTSGSIDDRTLETFFVEIHGIWRTGAEVVVIECDAAVQRTSIYKGTRPTGVSGRGGTDFDPAFRWMRERRRGKFDVCIYLTDGFGPAPDIRPPYPLLWVVTAGGRTGEHLRWGRAITLA
jgi:predicted metal-dependent peptidase